jgi:hypothetical protein
MEGASNEVGITHRIDRMHAGVSLAAKFEQLLRLEAPG